MISTSSAVEVRTARPVYFSDNTGQGIHLSVTSGRGHVTLTPASKVKIQRLAKGGYSVRCVGKGGFPRTLHVNPGAYIVMVTEHGSLIHGTVAEVFDNVV